ncbi:autotransporter assembly complex protein TamA [Acidithiobacillus sulfuriphilus]|uniref:autotransporter assembly complex protein TamA n=1 Tax=Acidithiobacillus sulfuriphilus TaxID=1867749 RepID=UPI003F614FA1
MGRMGLGACLGLGALLWAAGAMAGELRFAVRGVPPDLAAKLAKVLPVTPLPQPPAGIEDARLAAGLRLKDALEAYGYYAAEWTARQQDDGHGQYTVTFDLHLGQPLRVRALTLGAEGPGAELAPLRHLLGRFPLHQGDILDQVAYEDWKGRALALLQANGYARADYQRHEILIDRTAFWAEIYLRLNTGPRYRFGAVRFVGAEDYPRWFVARYLTFHAGDWYSPAQMALSQTNLRNADRFSAVRVTADVHGAQGDAIPVEVDLGSMPSQHLKLGAGYSTDLGPNLAFTYENYNVFHRAQHLHVSVLAAQRSRDIGGTYTWPIGTQLGSQYVAKALYQNQQLVAYRSNVFDVGGGRQWSLGPNQTLEALLSFQQSAYNVGGVAANARFILPSLQYSTQQFANLLRPVNGYSLTAKMEGASKVWGSSANLFRLSADGVWRTRLSPDWVLGTHAKLGGLWLAGSINAVPPELRFFAGGQNSLPGYAYLSQGPLASDGTVQGGRYLLVGGVDLQRFVSKDWAVVAFYDAGNAFDSVAQFRALQDVGLGVRWYSPFGPIRLDLAHPLIAPRTPAVRVVFSVGFTL